jgi:hypothetical protein
MSKRTVKLKNGTVLEINHEETTLWIHPSGKMSARQGETSYRVNLKLGMIDVHNTPQEPFCGTCQ